MGDTIQQKLKINIFKNGFILILATIKKLCNLENRGNSIIYIEIKAHIYLYSK